MFGSFSRSFFFHCQSYRVRYFIFSSICYTRSQNDADDKKKGSRIKRNPSNSTFVKMSLTLNMIVLIDQCNELSQELGYSLFNTVSINNVIRMA